MHSMRKELQQDRIKSFAIEIKASRHSLFEGEIEVLITHNGYQWSGFTLSPAEKLKLIKALQEAQ